MRLRPAILATLLFAVLAALPVAAQDPDMRTQDIRFDAGATKTSITDSITGREYVVYKVGAEAGQRMDIRLITDSTATYFNVYEPGRGPGDEALAVSEFTGAMVPEINSFSAELPTSGIYSVSVYLYRSAARRGESAEFTLDISITGEPGEIVQGDFADGLQGGPDFWRVQASGGLKLHDAPSTGAPVLTTLPNGLELRNLGCRMAEGRTWCNVATLAEPAFVGWAAGDFLSESSGETATQLPDMVPVQQGTEDALVPGTDFNATGMVECYPSDGAETQFCDFGVVREGNGSGFVLVTLPNGMRRAIFYDGGVPVRFDKAESDGDLAFEVKPYADGYIVYIGPVSLSIPNAVIYGG